jgi:hypothetical protein
VFLPSADQWSKAAFYSPQAQAYSLWATGSGTRPTAVLPTGTEEVTGENTANYKPQTQGLPMKMVDVGTYVNTISTYGLFDMVGNVNEMTDTPAFGDATKFQTLGGSWATSGKRMDSFYNSARVGQFKVGDVATATIGFRVAAVAVPEPGNMVAAALGIAGLVGVHWANNRKLALARTAGGSGGHFEGLCTH